MSQVAQDVGISTAWQHKYHSTQFDIEHIWAVSKNIVANGPKVNGNQADKRLQKGYS